MCVIGALDPSQLGHWILVILQVCLGLGAVIFVHELGHFLVAKLCGVQCDKFFIGFDIGGYKLSRQWGETEYGIGILPLGGYVKMLGQDDNPANIAEQVRESQVSGANSNAKEITGPGGEKYLVNQRSYLAKSVPQRMAIISAGVIMNVIFAFVFAAIAFGVGVPYIPCIVSQTSIGSPAWESGLRAGDEIVSIGDIKDPSFNNLRGGVMLGDLENGIDFVVRRAETGAEVPLLLKPKQGPGLARVGIFLPRSLRLAKQKPVEEESPADNASAAFQGDDEIVAIDGNAVRDYREFVAQLVASADRPLNVTVRRGGKAPKENPYGAREGGKEVTISVPAQPMRRLGLVMEMGKVASVVKESEAAKRGIQPGDFIDKVGFADDASTDQTAEAERLFADPITLPEQLRRLADQGRDVKLTVRSSGGGEGRQSPEEIVLPLERVTWMEPSLIPNDPLSVPALGIAYRVLSRVGEVQANSPASNAGLQSGDVITKAEFILPKSLKKPAKADPIEFGKEGQHNWPVFIEGLQYLPEGTQVKLTYERGEESFGATLVPEATNDQFVAERGFVFEPIQRIRLARSFGEQLELGYQETVNSLGMVFRFLRKLGTQIPLTSLGGPVTIAQAAGYSAFEGLGKLLVFLTILSANLAVINFLPIPLLDGGHMVFLAYEGVRGRPASERFVVALHTIGFAFIVTLMLFVLSLDLNIIPRNL